MTGMTRFTLSVVMTMVLGLFAYTLAGAQGPRRGPGAGPGGFGGPGFGRGGGAVLRGLELTEQQQAQINAIREQARGDAATAPAGLPLHRQLQAEVFADAPDPTKLDALQQQIAEAEAVRLARQIAIEQKIAAVLTDEQRAEVRERLAKVPAARGPRPGTAR